MYAGRQIIKATFYLFLLWPLAFAHAEEPPPALQLPTSFIDNKEISLENLAHSFFYHLSTSSEILEQLLSAEGVNRIKPEIAEHGRDMNDARKIARNVRQMCAELQNARSGLEFAAVLESLEQSERNGQEEAARRILSRLDVHDRKTLEEYLDTEFRAGMVEGRFDYKAMFASNPFPSTRTSAITWRACDSATKAEAKMVISSGRRNISSMEVLYGTATRVG
ncbi:MAG: hypothetical protein ACREVI_15510 [Steroidobacteraceae bacterium]